MYIAFYQQPNYDKIYIIFYYLSPKPINNALINQIDAYKRDKNLFLKKLGNL